MLKYLTSNPSYQSRGKAVLLVFKVGRTVVLGFTIYQLGVTHGMIYYASDPHAMEEQFIVNMVTEFGGKKLLNRRTKDYKMTEMVAKKVLKGAKHHCILKLEELELLQYRLDDAAKKLGHSQQSITGTQRHEGFKGPLKFINEVVAAYLKSSNDGPHINDTATSSTAMMYSAHLYPRETNSFIVPTKFDLPPNSKRGHEDTYKTNHIKRKEQFDYI